MKPSTALIIIQTFLVTEFVFCQTLTHTIDDIFFNLDPSIKEKALSASGYSSYFDARKDSASGLTLHPESALIAKNSSAIFEQNPSYIIESLFIVPAPNAALVDVFNALCKVRLLQGRTYHSARRGRDVALFEEAVTIENYIDTRKKNDLPEVSTLPESETIYMRLKAAHFGNCYFGAKIDVIPNGIFYSLNNFRSINYIIPIIKANRFLINLYLEPIQEGILIYGITGIDVSDFLTAWVDIPSLIQKRLDVIYGWISDGIIREQKNR